MGRCADGHHLATAAAREAGNSPVVEWGARLGYAVVGLIHLLIAWIALKVAWSIGGGSKKADTSGALETLTAVRHRGGAAVDLRRRVPPAGRVAAVEAALGHGETSDRLKAAAKGVTYLFFAWTTFKVGQGASSSAEKQTEDFTAGLMGSPGGRLLVGVVGLVVLGIAGYHVYKGWTKKFLEDLREHPGDWAVTAGRVGYIAKGVALVDRGVLLPRRGLAGRPRQGAGPRRRAQDGEGPALRAVPAHPRGRRHRRLRRLLVRPLALRAGLSGSGRPLARAPRTRCRMPAHGAGSSTRAARRARR